MIKTSTALSALLLATAAPLQAAQWFPPHPGTGETLLIIYSDLCGEREPVGTPTLTLTDADDGWWKLEIVEHDDTLCFTLPPPGSAGIYAFEMPESIDGIAVNAVEVVERVGSSETREFIGRPFEQDTPVSIAGTWTLPGAREQGLMLSIDDNVRLAAGLFTYDAQGRPAWYSGAAYGYGSNGSAKITVPLVDTVAGAFMATPGTPSQMRSWGEIEIDWQSCGVLQAAWHPAASTGLAAGEGTFRQLTGNEAAPCDLDAYAASRNGHVVHVAYDIVAD